MSRSWEATLMTYRIDLTERLLWILIKLTGRARSRQELAREFGVDPKTISHDIDALTRFHPIEERRAGREVIYSFGGDYKYTIRSEEHTSELQSRFGISYAVFCL